MRGCKSVLVVALNVVALNTVWLPVCLCAQQATPDRQRSNGPQSETKPYTLLSTTREVDLDIVVTDATGQPVRGLTKDDFQIFEDHELQRASGFEAQSTIVTARTLAAPSLPEGAFTNYVPPGSGNVLLVILLDSLDTPLNYQLYAYQQAIDFIKRLPPGVDVALFTLNARMELLQGFTSDPKLLLEAMHSKRAQPRPSYLLDSAPGSAIVREGSNDVYRQQLLLSGMATLGRYLAGSPGRKNLIWLTVDIPGNRSKSRIGMPGQTTQSGADATAAQPDPFPVFGDSSPPPASAKPSTGSSAAPAAGQATAGAASQSVHVTAAPPQSQSEGANDASRITTEGSEVRISSFDDVFDAATRALAVGRVAVYILDPRGLMGPAELAVNPDWRSQFAAMDHAAEATGGHAFYNSNRLDLVMNEVATEGSTYYRLTYSPSDKDWNGSFRHVQIKIAPYTKNELTSASTGRPVTGGLHLAYRPGYFASDSGSPASAVSAPPVAGSSAFILASEDKPANSTTAPPPAREGLQASMTMGELPPTEILFVASVKAVDGVFQLARNSALPTDDFMRAKFKYQPCRRINIVFVTNARSLSLPLATNGLHHGRIEFVTVIYNDQGEVVNSLMTGVSLDLREASYRRILETGIGAHQSIAVPVKGEYIVRLGIHDTTSDRVGALEIPFKRIRTQN